MASIAQYYDGKSVFLTGGSGFVGKVIVEKLLRSCPGVRNIYFLIRPKKGLECQDRLRKIFQMPLFDKLKEIDSEATKKVIPIPGDITHRRLGISDADWLRVTSDVNVVIHSAATVRFDEPLRVAMQMNCVAVKEVVGLVREVANLSVFCHISTAYSQCDRDADDVIKETFYPKNVSVGNLLEAMEWMDDQMLADATEAMIGKYPNTYTFTKALAESMLKEECGAPNNIPLVIVRPSIVCSTIRDPVPGWVDSYNGPSGIIVGIGKGVVRTLFFSGVKNDIVPVDMVSNCVLASIYYHATTQPTEPVICNCTSGNVNPTSFVDMELAVQETTARYPYNGIFRRPNIAITGTPLVHQYWQVVSHYIPAILADGVSILIGAKPRFMNIYKKLDSSLQTMDFFVHHEWRWDNEVFLKILHAVPAHERDVFHFDMKSINWDRYYRALTLGIKMYLVKDDMNELPKARRLVQRYRMVRWLSSLLFVLVVGRVFFHRSAQFRRLWFEALFGMFRLLRFLKVTTNSS